METLQARTIKNLLVDTTNEKKLNLLSHVCEDIPFKEFLNHPIVINKLKENICSMLDEIEKSNKYEEDRKDIEYLKYLFTNMAAEFIIFANLMNYNLLLALRSSTRPKDWKFCVRKDDLIIVLAYDMSLEEYPEKEPFDFEKDIIEKKFPPNNLKKIRMVENKVLNWWNL